MFVWGHKIWKKHLKEVSYGHNGCIYLITDTVKSVILGKSITIWNNSFFILICLKMYFIIMIAKLIFPEPLLRILLDWDAVDLIT